MNGSEGDGMEPGKNPATCMELAELSPLYLSGELDSRRAAALDAHLKRCPRCFEELRRQAQLSAARRERQTGVRPHRPRPWVLAVASATAMFLLAALGSLVLMGPQLGRVYASAAQDHRREIGERQPRRWVSGPAQIAALAERRGVPGSAVLALSAQGYHLDRGRLCFVGRRVFVHLVYSGDGHEFSVYLRGRGTDPLPGAIRETVNGALLRVADEGSQHVASVETSRLTVLIVVDQSPDAALRFARFASTVL
jgi:anti-sigma factor RsiW